MTISEVTNAKRASFIRSTFAVVTLLSSLLVGSAAFASDAAQESVLLQAAFSDLLDDKTQGVILSEGDSERYRTIFTAQTKDDWKKANAAMAKLDDRRLVGHVLADRYLRQTGYKTSYNELRAWLQHYADLPVADDIHALALQRQPQGGRAPSAPSGINGLQGGLRSAAVMANSDSPVWRAGLTAWRVRDYGTALVRFQQLARNRQSSPWEQSAGSFWTARCLARLHRPSEVTPWLVRAAAHPRTFYGLIASRQLGSTAALNWTMPDLTGKHLKALADVPAGRRALGLLQIGQMDLAEAELRQVKPQGNDTLEEALVALAGVAHLPNLALRVGASVAAPDGALYDAALYPMPKWKPSNGFKIDRALIYALIRQESRFEPEARSSVGATGLMQLMPATAQFVAGRSFNDKSDLHDPELNLTLGQSYVEHLLDQSEIKGNLFYMLASYNGGPTQAMRWKRDMGTVRDPLLFLESIPADETRGFAQRVLANYWVYQLQMGRDTPSLDAVAAGDWPLYTPDSEQVMVQASAQPTLH